MRFIKLSLKKINFLKVTSVTFTYGREKRKCGLHVKENSH